MTIGRKHVFVWDGLKKRTFYHDVKFLIFTGRHHGKRWVCFWRMAGGRRKDATRVTSAIVKTFCHVGFFVFVVVVGAGDVVLSRLLFPKIF